MCVCAPVALETAASPLEILSRVRPFVPPDQRPSVSIRFLFSTEMSAWKNSNHLTRGKAGGLFSGRRTCRHTMGFKIRHSSKLRHGFETFHASGMQFNNACTIVQSRKPNRPRFFFLVLTSKNLQRSTRTISNTQSHLSSAAMSHDDNDVCAGPESAARLLGRGRVIARQFRDRVSPSSRAPLAPHPLRSSTKRSNTRNTVKCHRQKAIAPNQGDMCSCPLRGIKAQSAPPTCTYRVALHPPPPPPTLMLNALDNSRVRQTLRNR